jgi:predicted regulator of Ras-like GTPase activity (Roadblock/LC7/MglB family)
MLGNLQDMSVADLIQHNCQELRTACLSVKNHQGQGDLYFEDGKIVHASLNGQTGENVVYEILGWEEGTFDLQMGVTSATVTINRGWSSLLIEGARRLDENETNSKQLDTEFMIRNEGDNMANKIDAILKELAGEVDGYIASDVVGMDGMNIASHSNSKIDNEGVSAQMTMLFKLVDTSVTKTGLGILEDNILTTANSYLFTRYLPDKQYFLGILADRHVASLGNLRLIGKIYVERIERAMPHHA